MATLHLPEIDALFRRFGEDAAATSRALQDAGDAMETGDISKAMDILKRFLAMRRQSQPVSLYRVH
jgi:hypothetical protein